jgi:ABC-type multidrug transport system fused ATPase/permease subunit
MESGKIVEAGTHEGLLAKKQSVYRKMVALQTEHLG